MKSLISRANVEIAKCMFTPIIPHPVTEYSTIYTCLKNYQDILNQRHIPYGPLQCDKEVYPIAKTIQLLKRDEIKNIFLRLGGFHKEKTALACLGKYLEKIGSKKCLKL